MYLMHFIFFYYIAPETMCLLTINSCIRIYFLQLRLFLKVYLSEYYIEVSELDMYTPNTQHMCNNVFTHKF